ncbi:hypothetical protein HBI48_039760 [Parastagonospora nodorum]|nr:hypothetical protein HBI48_039760 [Parastagonospora nodorum]
MNLVTIAEQSSQGIAGAALSFLPDTDEDKARALETSKTPFGLPATSKIDAEAVNNATQLAVPKIEVTTPTYNKAAIGQYGVISGTQSPQASTAPRVLPSLLRYVDNDLMQSSALHNQPPHPISTCGICFSRWDAPVISTQSGRDATTSTFLPLSPCGHWVHYRCFIWLATMNDGRRNKCCTCDTRLFEWDGITALTLATRTGLDLDDNTRAGFRHDKFGAFKATDRRAYEVECAVIDSTIHVHFFAMLAKPSKYADHSPDLVQCFYNILEALKDMGKPAARWLQFSTQTGYLLWGMLVALKMGRYLTEGHGIITTTEAWKEFEEGRRVLQGRISSEVHGALMKEEG